jgi:hypothetical protein
MEDVASALGAEGLPTFLFMRGGGGDVKDSVVGADKEALEVVLKEQVYLMS